jgi:hypothetical protein
MIQNDLLGVFRKRKNGFVITTSAPISSRARDMAIIKDIINITCHNSLPDTNIAVYSISIDFNIFFVCDAATAKMPSMHGNMISLRKSINIKIIIIEIKYTICVPVIPTIVTPHF